MCILVSVEEVPHSGEGCKGGGRPHGKLGKVRKIGEVGLEFFSYHCHTLQLALVLLEKRCVWRCSSETL